MSTNRGHSSITLEMVKGSFSFQVNEEGAEAAAATGCKMTLSCLPPSLNVNHPFLFFIVSDTGYPVFMGHVVKPEYKA